MKFFKYFTYKELKYICQKLDKRRCYYRHPQEDFIEILGNETVNKLLDAGCIKYSPRITYPGTDIPWNGDYYRDCYEFCKKFKRVFNYLSSPFWLWFRIYVLHTYLFRIKWQSFRIWCGHHYDWQDYDGIYSLDEI